MLTPFDSRMLVYFTGITVLGVLFSFAGPLGPLLTLFFTLGINYFYLSGRMNTLFLGALYLDFNSLIWGGVYGPINLPVDAIDSCMTKASSYLFGLIIVHTIFNNGISFKITSIDKWLFSFAVYTGITLLFSYDFDNSLDQFLRSLNFLALYYVTRKLLIDFEGLRLYFQSFLASFVLVFVALLIQLLSGYFGDGYGQGRPGDIAKFIPYLLGILPFKYTSRSKAWLLILLSLFISLYHGSRRIILMLIVYFSRYFKLRLSSLILAIVIVFISPLILNYLPKNTFERINDTVASVGTVIDGDVSDKTLDRLGTNRWSLTKGAIDMWLERPFIGIGLNNNRKFMRDIGGFKKNARVHNFYLEILVDVGLIGFFFVAGIIISVFYCLRKIHNKQYLLDKFMVVMIVAFIYELSALHLSAIFGSSMLYTKRLWVLYGIAANIHILLISRRSLSHERVKKLR